MRRGGWLIPALVTVLVATASADQVSGAAAQGTHRCPNEAVILLVHGGGWWRGSPSIVSHAVDYTERRSDLFKPVAVRYSLGSVAQAFRDLAASARYWRQRGCRVFAYGESNGANMVENLASRGLVSAAAAVSPPTNLLSWSYRAHSYRTYGRDLSTPAGRAYAENPSSARMSWANLDATPRVLRRMSPSLHPYDAGRQAPLLIFQSCDDTVVKCAMNLKYARSDGSGGSRPSNRIRYRPVRGDHATPAVKAASFRVSYRWFRSLVL